MRHFAIAALMGLGMAAGLGPSARALDLVKDGAPLAGIVLPDQATPTEQKAAQTLAKYVKMSSGAALKIVKEAEKPEGTIISLGHTGMAKAAGISDEDLQDDGYRLQVRNGALYVLGRDAPRTPNEDSYSGAQGSLRAVFGLLERWGFRWVQPTPKGTHVPEMKTVSVADDLSVKYLPPFVVVHGANMERFGDWSMADNFRCAVNVYTEGGHTWHTFVPASLWDTHPEYFQMRGGKRVKPVGNGYFLCPSNLDVQKLLADGIRKKFDEGYDWVQLGQSDGYTPCECDQCKALDKPGECHEQVELAHYNVIQMLQKTNPDKKVHLLIYDVSKKPSAHINQYPPNTVLEICCTGSLAEFFGGSMDAGVKFWSSKAPAGSTVYVYYMGAYHVLGFAPKFTPRMISDEIHKLHEWGVKGIYFCGGSENWGCEGPTYYVAGRICGDLSLGWSSLLDEYCALTYGRAAKTMRRYYDLLYSRIESPARELSESAEVFTALYPPRVLGQLQGLLELAKSQAVGDERALGWLRLVELQHRHFSTIARVCHLHNAYEIHRTMENLKQTAAAVAEYKALADEILGLKRTDPAFAADYFVNLSWWKDVHGNGGMGGPNLSSPFTWDFDALIKANVLPGNSRARAVVTRLDRAPQLDGAIADPAWEKAPWVDMPEVSLGKVEAKTRFKLGYDDQCLYGAFECEEPAIEEMIVPKLAHDGDIWEYECIELFFNPEADGAKYMHLIAGPAPDNRYDARLGYIDDPYHPLFNQEDVSWNPQWRHAFKIDKANKRWTLEVAIPFASLGTECPAEGARWRGNFGRERHKSKWAPPKYADVPMELSLWSPNLQKCNFCDATVAGDLFFGRIPETK